MLDNHWTGRRRPGGPARPGSARSATASSRRSSAGTARASRRESAASEILLTARLVASPTWSRCSTARRHRGGGRGRPAAPRDPVRPRGRRPLRRARRRPRCAGLDEASTWDAVIGLSRPGRAAGRASSTRRWRRSPTSPTSSRRTRSGTRAAWPTSRGGGARSSGWAPAARQVRRAGLVHDLGRLGVPNTIWDKPGPLSHAETERVRLHPYLTERMLACSPGAGAAGRDRGPAPRAAGRLRLPARAVRRAR